MIKHSCSCSRTDKVHLTTLKMSQYGNTSIGLSRSASKGERLCTSKTAGGNISYSSNTGRFLEDVQLLNQLKDDTFCGKLGVSGHETMNLQHSDCPNKYTALDFQNSAGIVHAVADKTPQCSSEQILTYPPYQVVHQDNISGPILSTQHLVNVQHRNSCSKSRNEGAGTSYGNSVRMDNNDNVVIIFQKSPDRKATLRQKNSVKLQSICKHYYNKMRTWMAYNVSRPEEMKASRFIPRCLTGFHELDCQLMSDVATNSAEKLKQGQEDELMAVLSKINEVFLETACHQNLYVNWVYNRMCVDNIERA